MDTMNKRMVLAGVALFLLSCSKDENNGPDPSTATVLTDVAYGSAERNRMDVYLPANRSSGTPVVMIVHGGGFIAGDRSHFSELSAGISARGYAVLNINYRLVDSSGALKLPPDHKPSEVKLADQLTDLKSAADYAAARAGEWTISAGKWAVAGHSAGGTLALLFAYGNGNTGGRVKAVGNWAGVTNLSFADESQVALLDPRLLEIFYRLVGHEATNANKLAYMAVSPYWVVSSGRGIPTINIRPEHNNIFNMPDGSHAEYQSFTHILTEKNVPNKWVEIAGADHGFGQPGNWQQVADESLSFFDTLF